MSTHRIENGLERSPRVSVVTPFFNTEAYLAECIKSVLRQTYDDWEYILVDNQSTDSSPDIAAKFAADDRRIRVVRTPAFFSQVQNYNFALRQISPSSEFVKVLEADNWLFPACLEKMVGLAEAHPSVGLVSSLTATERAVRFTGLHRSQTVIQGREAARRLFLEDAYWFGSPTTVLMRARFVRRRPAFYDESAAIAEDQLVCYEILQEADFGFIHELLTFVRTENESILSGRKGYDAFAVDRYIVLHRYGQTFLDPTDYANVLHRVRRNYYQTLARAVLRRVKSDYWNFHRTALTDIGVRIELRRLTAAVLRELLWRGLNPGQTIADLLRRGRK